MKPDPFAASLMHDGDGIAVRDANDLTGEVFCAG